MAKDTVTSAWRLVREPTALVPWDEDIPELKDGRAVDQLLRPLARLEECEVLWALPLDSGLRLLTPGPVVVARGTTHGIDLPAGTCFRTAVMVGAVGLIVAHNHPNGLSRPSQGDRIFTMRLKQAGELLDIVLHDHVILGAKGFYSFKTSTDVL